jgi:hypothetical protein
MIEITEEQYRLLLILGGGVFLLMLAMFVMLLRWSARANLGQMLLDATGSYANSVRLIDQAHQHYDRRMARGLSLVDALDPKWVDNIGKPTGAGGAPGHGGVPG